MRTSHRLAAPLFALALCQTAAAADTELAEHATAWANAQGNGAVVLAEKRDGAWQFALGGDPHIASTAPVAPEAVEFEIGSISKVFTGLLLAHAVHEGKLALGDTLAQRLPVEFDDGDVGAITLQQLATHTSCLPRLPSNLFVDADQADPYAHYDDTRLFAYLASATIDTPAPCASAYSNLGIGVLGVVLERAYGTSWAALVSEKIATPLGMPDTAQTLDSERTARLAQGWDGTSKAPHWTFASLAGAGALRSTAADMARFADALLAGADGPLRPVWASFVGPYADAPGGKSGLAIVHTRIGGEPALWHNGGTGGFRSDLRVFPDSDRALLLLASNAKADPDAWLASLAEDTLAPVAEGIAIPTESLDDYTGVYTLSPDARLTIVRVDDGLRARLTGQTFLPIVARSADEFVYTDVDARLGFERDAAGKVVAVTLHQNGRDTRIARTDATAPTFLFPGAEALAEYVGDYDFGAFQPGASIAVRAVGDVLTAQLTGQAPLPVHNTAPDRFEWDVVPAALVFERDAGGRIVAVVLEQNGARMRSPRK
ncbi:serine hydrolase [Chiayiivirga flava]|uniref:Beta-lactamase n=1 Tax=Chiayiivirga flava TaxID=659595 RepID=A0A7W8D5W9_9GAMM|nr:serine hydrolase [Chiayiivirga flava]MBB5208480.1 CubicO group peptidase (beta-lactamase class C family) [Chiayiivirga flava]